MEDYVEIIRSNKGGLKLIHKGYMYTVHKKRQSGGIRWRCTQRGLHCKGSISTGYGPPKVNMAHNHIPDPHSVAIARCRQAEEYTDVTSFLETEYEEIRGTCLACLTFMEDHQYNLFVATKHQQKYDISFKRNVILLAERRGNAIAKKFYKVHESNIRRWRKHKWIIFRDWMRYQESLNKSVKPESLAPNSRVRSPSPPVLQRVVPRPSFIQPQMIPESHNQAESEEVCLRWNSHYNNMKKSFPLLLNSEKFTDCTIATDNGVIKCHQLILSSCSSYFDNILSGIDRMQHPVIFIKGIKHWILKALIDFMYIGEIHIEQTKLPDLLEIAETLHIKGLTGKSKKDEPEANSVNESNKVEEQRMVDLEKPSTSKAANSKPVIITKLAPRDDSMSLLTPSFFEDAAPDTSQKSKEGSAKKQPVKKIKKRKIEHHEPSPPPLMLRKGTKSRPNVKMPKHYHNDYEAFDLKKSGSSSSNSNASSTPTHRSTLKSPDKDFHIKLEPLDMEEGSMDYDPLQLPEERAEKAAQSTSKTPAKNQDQNNLSKILHKVKIIKVHPESLLKANQSNKSDGDPGKTEIGKEEKKS